MWLVNRGEARPAGLEPATLGREGRRYESARDGPRRVVLDHELKSEYQRWLHERDTDHDDYDGHPDRTPDEIREWAYEHDLPYFDDEVHFPDVRVEYQEPDGRWEREDIEVVTSHYRGAHSASVARSGFSCYRGLSLRLSTSGAGRRGGRDGGLAEELWRRLKTNAFGPSSTAVSRNARLASSCS